MNMMKMKPLTSRILVQKKTQGQLTFVEVGWSARTILPRENLNSDRKLEILCFHLKLLFMFEHLFVRMWRTNRCSL